MGRHSIKLRPYEKTLLPKSKMRNRGQWECPDCGTLPPSCFKPKGKPKCVDCGAQMIHHASQKEFKRWKELQALQKAGQIRNLERQVRIPLDVGPVRLKTPKGRDMVYKADFVYEQRVTGGGGRKWNWPQIVEDVKGRRSGTAYDLFWLKREILRANGIEVREI